MCCTSGLLHTAQMPTLGPMAGIDCSKFKNQSSKRKYRLPPSCALVVEQARQQQHHALVSTVNTAARGFTTHLHGVERIEFSKGFPCRLLPSVEHQTARTLQSEEPGKEPGCTRAENRASA